MHAIIPWVEMLGRVPSSWWSLKQDDKNSKSADTVDAQEAECRSAQQPQNAPSTRIDASASTHSATMLINHTFALTSTNSGLPEDRLQSAWSSL